MANWKAVKPSSLSDAEYERYSEYVARYREVSALGQRLKDAVTADWNTRFPDGQDGEGCAFRALNGVLQYAKTKKKKARAKSKGKFEEDVGDDVFAKPTGLPNEPPREVSASTGARLHPVAEQKRLKREAALAEQKTPPEPPNEIFRVPIFLVAKEPEE